MKKVTQYKIMAVILGLVFVLLWVFAERAFAQPQTCQQKPEVVPFFAYDPAEVNHPIMGAVMVDSNMPFTHRIGVACQEQGLPVSISITGPFTISIGEQPTLSGGTVQNVVTITGTGNLQEKDYYEKVTMWTYFKREEWTVVISSIDTTPPFLSPLPSGIESCEGCYDGS